MSVGAQPSFRGPAPAAASRGISSSFAINLRIIGALMMREGSTRYGHENLGFFWVMGEPLVLTCGVMLLWTVTGATHGHAVSVVIFALTGYMVLTLWRHLTGHAVHSIRNSGSLLFHHNIRILDVMIARALLECLGVLAAFFIAWVPLALMGAIGPMTDPLLFIAGFSLHAWFSFSFGCIIAALSEIWTPTEQFVPPLLYLTLPITGTFSLAAWLPQSWREMLMWSPLANTQEMVRAGTFPPNNVFYYYPTYVVLVCLVLTAIALPLVHYAQKQTSFS